MKCSYLQQLIYNLSHVHKKKASVVFQMRADSLRFNSPMIHLTNKLVIFWAFHLNVRLNVYKDMAFSQNLPQMS